MNPNFWRILFISFAEFSSFCPWLSSCTSLACNFSDFCFKWLTRFSIFSARFLRQEPVSSVSIWLGASRFSAFGAVFASMCKRNTFPIAPSLTANSTSASLETVTRSPSLSAYLITIESFWQPKSWQTCSKS